MRACLSVHGIGLVGTQQQAAGVGAGRPTSREKGGPRSGTLGGNGSDLALPSLVPGPEGLDVHCLPAGWCSPDASLYRVMESTLR